MCRQSEKKLVNQMAHNMVNFGPLAAEIGPVVWGTPANFNGFCILAVLLHSTPAVRVSQTLQRWTDGAPPIFGRAAIMLGIGPHSSLAFYFFQFFAGKWFFTARKCSPWLQWSLVCQEQQGRHSSARRKCCTLWEEWAGRQFSDPTENSDICLVYYSMLQCASHSNIR